MEIDEFIDARDDEEVVKALINSTEVKYRSRIGRPLIQVLPNGTWFVQKIGGRGLGKDPTAALLEALKKK